MNETGTERETARQRETAKEREREKMEQFNCWLYLDGQQRNTLYSQAGKRKMKEGMNGSP
jgi:hypothetical protein